MSLLSIGKLARQSGVGVETIRYYERRGLLAEPERRPSGYRQYSVDVVARLEFILRSKKLGFTLAEIKELLLLRFEDADQRENARSLAQRKLVEIDDKIRTLQEMRQSLGRVLDECQTGGAQRECPLCEQRRL